jgi:hypothetical protein
MWLLTQDEETKQWGYFVKTPESKSLPVKVTWGKYSFSDLTRAKKAAVYIYTKANYESSPDLYVSNDLKKEVRLSTINPQQAQYNWGTAELVHGLHPKGINPPVFYTSRKILIRKKNIR